MKPLAYTLWDGIDCGYHSETKPSSAHPIAQLWKGNDDTWAYSLNVGSGDEWIYCGFTSELAARQAALTDIYERMQESACEAAE